MVIRAWHVGGVAVLILVVGVLGGIVLSGGRNDHASTVVLSVADTEASAPSQAAKDSTSAKANVRAAIPGVESYNADHAVGYEGLTLASLQAYDTNITGVAVVHADSNTYCVESTVGQAVWHKDGPAAPIAQGACA